jgi:hypothetical protein
VAKALQPPQVIDQLLAMQTRVVAVVVVAQVRQVPPVRPELWYLDTQVRTRRPHLLLVVQLLHYFKY